MFKKLLQKLKDIDYYINDKAMENRDKIQKAALVISLVALAISIAALILKVLLMRG